MALANSFLGALPVGFSANVSGAVWGYYSTVNTAALDFDFNRTAVEPPWQVNTTNPELEEANAYLNSTDFVAFDPSFFDLIGPNARSEHVWESNYTWIHEASCFVPDINSLFFTSWGFVHDYQYLLDARTYELRNITTSPPIVAAHGCTYYNGSLYVATDGGNGSYASIYKVNPTTLEAEVIINNFYQQPFLGFNDLDIDPNGNIWVTDSTSAWSNSLTTFAPQTGPGVYFINATTRTPKWVFGVDGGWLSNVNGIAFAPNGTLYVDVTSINSGRPKSTDALRARSVYAFDTRGGTPVLRDQRLFANPISRFFDGVRVSANGYVWAVSSDGVDVIEPESGLSLGRIRTPGTGPGGDHGPVNVAFEDHVLWIVGRGGVWRVSGIREQLKRGW